MRGLSQSTVDVIIKMSDVAHILGVSAATAAVDTASPFIRRGAPESLAVAAPAEGAAKKPKKISRELAGILGKDVAAVAELQTMVPVKRMVLGGLKARRDAGKARRWVWKSFTSSARRDGAQFYHWVRADAEFADYPFTRFNKRADIIR